MNDTLSSKTHSKENAFSLFLIYAFVTIAVYVLPATKFLVPYIIAAGLMLSSIILLIIKKTPCVMFFVWLAITSMLLMVLNFTSFSSGINEMIRNVRFFLPVIWGCYALKYCNKKQLRLFLILFFVLVVFIFIKTTIALDENAYIARILAQGKQTSDHEINAYRLQNIGGFEFSYMMGLITLCFVYLALKTKRSVTRILCIVATILCFYYIIQTMYTLLLILTSFCTVLLIFIHIKNIYLKIALVFAFVMLVFFLADIFKMISMIFPADSLLSMKFMNMHKAIIEENISEVGSRPQLIMNSLEAWIKNPLFGSSRTDLNSHSMLINILATDGILGFGSIIVMFYQTWKISLYSFGKSGLDSLLFKIGFVFVVLLAFLNPIGYVFEVTMAAFFIIPIWVKCID